MATATNQSFRERVRQRRAIDPPIAWLDEPVSLCDDGRGPLVLGVAKDAMLGRWKLQQLQMKGEQ
jgi:hypothetical protein